MPSTRALYNEEVIHAHREALAALRRLLAQEKDPLELRKLANAILRARPIKVSATDEPASPAKSERAAESEGARLGEGDLPATVSTSHDHPALGTDETTHPEADELARRLMTTPDPLACLREMQMVAALGSAPFTSTTYADDDGAESPR